MDGLAIRVPTPTVSIVDVVMEVEKSTTKEEVNSAFKEAAGSSLKGILDFCELPLVSVDIKKNPASSIVDADNTFVFDNMVKVLSWYDNEWGYSTRLIDLVEYIHGKGL